MNLPDEAVNEFRNLYLQLFEVDISFETAKIEAENFIKYFDLISTV